MHGGRSKLCAKLSSTFLRKWCKYSFKVDFIIQIKIVIVNI